MAGSGEPMVCARREWRVWFSVAVRLLLVAPASACTGSFMDTSPAPAPAQEFTLAPGQTAMGEVKHYTIQQGDVLPDIARRFDLGYTALAAANPGVHPWAPAVGREITIPSQYVLPDAPHRGVVINLAQYRLYYFEPNSDRVVSYPIGIGVIGKKTPLGATRVARKQANPTWRPPASIHAEHPDLPAAVPPGPDNPLGAFALYLGWPKYLIHGTNKPDGIGRNVSHGCIHLYPEDIARLFPTVPEGAPVRVVNQPATAGWEGDALYVAVYPTQAQAEAIDTEHPVSPDPAPGVAKIVRAAAGEYADLIDWKTVDRAAKERSGMPVPVARKSVYAGRTRPAETSVSRVRITNRRI
jgi:L,D-transpeptidase ErfK/SrfK